MKACSNGLRAKIITPHERGSCTCAEIAGLLGASQITTIVAAQGIHGPSAAMTITGAINGATLIAYVEQVLASTLKPGEIDVMDNLGSHNDDGVRQAIEACGAEVVYLPS